MHHFRPYKVIKVEGPNYGDEEVTHTYYYPRSSSKSYWLLLLLINVFRISVLFRQTMQLIDMLHTVNKCPSVWTKVSKMKFIFVFLLCSCVLINSVSPSSIFLQLISAFTRNHARQCCRYGIPLCCRISKAASSTFNCKLSFAWIRVNFPIVTDLVRPPKKVKHRPWPILSNNQLTPAEVEKNKREFMKTREKLRAHRLTKEVLKKSP